MDKGMLKDASRSARRVVAAVGLGVAAMGLCGLVEVDRAVVAEGEVVPSGQSRKASHFEGGVVEEILAREGQHVKAGQPLVRLSQAKSGASLEELTAQAEALRGTASRLAAEAAGREEVEWPSSVPTSVREREASTFAQRTASLRSQTASLESEIKARKAELAGLRANEGTVSRQVAMYGSHDGYRSQHLNAQAELDRIRTQVASLPGQIDSLGAKLDVLKAEARAKASEELAKVDAELKGVEAKIGSASDTVRRTEIVSPVDGVVQSLSVRSKGETVSPNAEVAMVVPTEGGVTFEAKVRPEDRKGLAVGQRTLVRLTAFEGLRYRPLEGEVVDVSPTVFTDEATKRRYYKARVTTPAAEINGEAVTAGMQGSAHVLTGTRLLAEYFLGPVADVFRQAFRDS